LLEPPTAFSANERESQMGKVTQTSFRQIVFCALENQYEKFLSELVVRGLFGHKLIGDILLDFLDFVGSNATVRQK